MLLMATAFAKMCQNMARGAKAVALNMLQNFGRNVGKTELPLLCHLHYVGAFAHYTNRLLK
jgi:hypothetical protein